MRARDFISLIVLLMPCAAVAEAPADDGASEPLPAAERHPAPGYERCAHDLSVLLESFPDSPGPFIGLRPPLTGASFTLEEPVVPLGVPLETLVKLIQLHASEGGWDDNRTSIRVDGNRLVVVQKTDVQTRIASLLSDIRRMVDFWIEAEGCLAVVEDAFLDELRAGAPDPSILTAEAERTLETAFAQGQRASRVATLRAKGRNTQRIHVAQLVPHPYIETYVISRKDDPPMPSRRELQLGTVLDIRPSHASGRFCCEVRFSQQSGALPIPAFDPAVKGVGPIGLPDVSQFSVDTSVLVNDGCLALVARAPFEAVPASRRPPARSSCLFLRLRAVPAPTVPPSWPVGPCSLRLFPVGPLYSMIRDFPGERFGIGSPAGDGAFYYYGDPDAGKAVIPSMPLMDEVKSDVAPGSWDADGHSIDYDNGILQVRHTPGILNEVQRFLDMYTRAHLKRVSTRVELLSVDAPMYSTLQERHPALRSGSARIEPAQAADLLSRAAKGDGLTLAASGEVLGMNCQRVSVKRSERMAYVVGYEADGDQPPLPQVDVAAGGFQIDCRPVLSEDNRTVIAELRIQMARLAKPFAVAPLDGKGMRIQQPACATFHMDLSIVAEAGDWMLAGVTGLGSERYLLAVVRFVPGLP